jgi:hypothetical protein
MIIAMPRGRPRVGGVEHDLVVAQRARAQAQVAAGVHDVDVDAILGGALVAHRLQPGGHLRAAARRGDDEIGAQLARRAARDGALAHGHAGHAPAVAHEL